MKHMKRITGGGSLPERPVARPSTGKKRFAAAVAAFAMTVAVGAAAVLGFNQVASAASSSVVDPDTTNVWSDIAASSTSTQNIGRIWTDKSVFNAGYTFSGSIGGETVSKGDSDFLVSLSALSSTSNLKTTTTTSQPLDIVLVLDDSGSMAYSIDSDTPNQIAYTAVSADQVVESHGHTETGWFGSTSYVQDTRGGEYYVQNDRGGYDRVTEVTETHGGWPEGSYEEHIRWTVNGQTVDPETTQFYTRTEYDLSERRGALQYAVSNFIDQAAAMNAQIADENDKIRISIVVFDSNSSIENHLTVCEGANVGTLKNTVNNLEANGATNAGAGMTNANNELRTNSNREDTKQIVIFFTDGVPTTSNSFNTTVANNAVGQAAQIKNRGGSVYSIGIFDGADPSQTEVRRNPNDTDRANVFMNAVSSNYPNASAWNNLGQRASGNPDFYKSADNAGSLNEVFQDIFDESTENAGSGSPIEEVTHEGELNPGTLTFTDNLGSYMEVTGGSMTVVYGDHKFTSTGKTAVGNVDTYHFEGTVSGNAVYEEANLSDLTVTVTRSSDLATGDKVTVEIPASLIPMRNYDVDTNEKTMSVSDAYPIRLFYGVSVKQDAEDAVNAGTGDVYDAIKEDHLSEEGTIDFYSNAYTKNAPNGLTVATFKPSEGNKFYYYTQNTPLYVDEECSTRATSSNIGNYDRVYYADTYWKTEGGTTSETTEGVPIVRGGVEFGKIQYDQQGRAYMPADTQRTDRPHTLITEKEDFEGGNATGTALNVLVPGWNDDGTVSQDLGNNGKISYPAPGELEIKKGVDWGNASDETKQSQNSFEFTVNFNGDQTLSGEFSYDVYESGEEPVRSGKVTDGGTVTLEDGQRAVIKGLPADTTFTVTETEANQNGFTTTDTVTADPSNDTTDGIANGTIVGGSQQSVSFQNNYKADEPLTYDVSDGLSVEKVLDGRDWRDGDEFTFNVQALDGYAPTQTEVTINKDTPDHKVSFGTITFDKDGEFRYVVREDNDTESPIVGIDYSNATYRLTVKVVDAGNGELKIESAKLEMFQDDTGAEKNPAVAVEGTTATFTNYYLSDQGTINIDGRKAYTDTTDDNPIAPNKFQFTMEALGGYVTDGGSRDNLTVSADDTPKPTENTQSNVTTIGNVGNEFHMPTITFDGNDVGNTYVYKITEVQGSEDGMTYDETSYEVEVEVTEVPDPEAGEGHVYIQATANKTPEQLTFTNKYEPTPATLTGDDVIHGTKTLEGRQMKEGETFYFQLSAVNDNAKAVLATPETVTVTDQNAMDFAFAEMTFTKVGTYTFQVNEVADEQGTETANVDGMTFDTNICTVTVTVTDGNDSDNPDDHGKLLASVSYSNDKHSDVTDHAQFTNVYEASMNYGADGAGGIAVTKTMVDRPMAAGDFSFTLTGTGPDGELTEEFENTAAAANVAVTMKQLQSLTFDEQDAEKTFTFTVDEADPTDDNRLPGVEYDQSQYRVDITVHDNHDGTMYTETTVTKIMNADGTEANDVVVDKLNSSTAQGQVPTFGFENVYEPTEASLDGDTALQVTKKVTGADSPDGVNYSFTLTAQNTAEGSVANIGGLTDGELTVSTSGVISEDSEQTVPFGTLTFSEPGTYTFTVQEDQPAADDGWTFDDADGNGVTDEHTVKVEVSYLNENNEYDGELHIKSVTPEYPTLITNSYKADPVIVGGEDAEQQITVQKSVTGADSNAEFKFEIEPVIDDDHTQQWWQERVKGVDGFSPELTISGVTQEQSATEAFDGIQFNAVGEYKFTVTEVGAAEFNAGSDRKGWTYDEHTATVTVIVTDEGNDGQLDAAVSYDNTSATTGADQAEQNAAAFTNKYEAGSTTLTGGSTTFNGSKTVEGRSWIDGESFGFTMNPVEQEGVDWSSVTYKANDASEPVAVGENNATASENGDATVSFWFPGTYTFTKAGTYTFNVTETQHNGAALPSTDENGMTYDRHTGVITVTVDDNGEGQLVATAAAGTVAEDDVATGATENDMSFENAYTAEPITWGFATGELLGGHKYINDTTGNTYTLGEGQFSFTMRAQAAGNPMPDAWDGTTVDSQGRGMMTVTNGTGDASAVDVYDFGWIEFTHDDMAGATAVDGQPGVYTKNFQYNIFESGNMPAGISKDNTAYTVTFTVTEDHNTGKMTATPSAVKIVNGGDGEATTGDAVDVTELDFTNTYNPTSIDSYMNIFKTLEGRNWQTGDTFTFNVSMTATETDDSPWPQDAPLPSVDAQGSNYTITEAEKNDAGDGFSYTVTINPTSATGNTYRFDTGKITYEREGIYTYTVSEADSTVNNVAKDDTEYTVVVTVTDEGGVLKREVTSVTPDLGNHGAGDQAFAALDFTNVFTPTEYQGVPVGFGFTKVLENRAWDNPDLYSFTFVLTPVDGAPLPEGGNGVEVDEQAGVAKVTVSAPDAGSTDTATFNFGEIKYQKAGEYRYTVSEQSQSNDYMTYDPHTAEVTVTVEEVKDQDGNLTGALSATATISNGSTFTNAYHTEADYTGNIGLDITKQVTNHAMADGQFSFTIEATGDNADAAAKKLGIQNGTTTTVESAQAAAGVATSVKNNPFETIKFDKSDDGVTYTYTIEENGTTGEDEYKNYVLDDTTYEVEITATDNGDGTMSVKTVVNGTEYVDQRATAAFENSYKADPTTVGAEGAATIEGTKTLKNDTLAANQFTFQVKSGDVVVSTGTNAADGTITFDDITYTTENLAAATTAGGSSEVGKVAGTPQVTDEGTVYTFNYVVSEVAPDPSTGVTTSSSVQNITITVTDDGNGTLTPEVSYGDGDPLAFENVYGGDAEYLLDIAGTKEIVGAQDDLNVPTLTADAYEFTIVGHAAADGTPAPMPDDATVGNDASGNVTFKGIRYTMENTFGSSPETAEADAEATADEAAVDGGIETYTANRTKVFTYTINESPDKTVAGVTNDSTPKTVEVTVTDLGGGKLKAEVTSAKTEDGADFEFTNVYDVMPETSSLTDDGGFTITKDFSSTNTDRPLAAGEFEFVLKSGNDVVATAANDASGNVSFGGIEFTKPGTYSYVLSEVNNGIPGVDYDTTSYNVTATVKDLGNGTLEVTWDMPQAVDGGVGFKNTYTAASTSIAFNAAKVLEGRELAEGEFTFELRENGTVIGAATNAADGSVSFEELVYNEPGEHDYQIVEVAGDADSVTYDATVYTVHVSVTDDPSTGRLSVAWAYGETGAPVFHNVYSEPEQPAEPVTPAGDDEPTDVTPDTGDHTNAAAPVALGLVGIALVGGALVARRRRG